MVCYCCVVCVVLEIINFDFLECVVVMLED